MTAEAAEDMRERLRVVARGAVQGVGFRPFVYRLARRLGLTGWVQNSNEGVLIEVEGPEPRLSEFCWQLRAERPPRAVIQGLETTRLTPRGETGFEIRRSNGSGERSAVVLPDIATCEDCRRELFDPGDRRYLYPFTNCTSCGPRYSIVLALPYDRAQTTMARFGMCAACHAEYEDPSCRRFHAEPIACPACGPTLTLHDPRARPLARGDEALRAAADVLRQGRILALKGLGGFHLLVDARDEGAVRRLRSRKRRGAKPFAVMTASVDDVRRLCVLDEREEALLASPEAPIVLAPRLGDAVAASVAPENPDLGVLLPYTPLHHLLLHEVGFPVVATSGNLSDEPLAFEEQDALARLGTIADVFLVHDRPIARPVDDSVVRMVGGRELVLRRARGYAPFPISWPGMSPGLLAVGGHLKSTVAVSVGSRVFVSPHVGDLGTEPAARAFSDTVDALCRLYGIVPRAVVCDQHPDYASSQFARDTGREVVAVQHHHAHVLACMADNDLAPPVLGFAWDGAGHGLDGTIWGGEALRVREEGFLRFAWLLPFPLPGGDRAAEEPRRSALGALYATDPAAAEELALFSPRERSVLLSMIRGGVNTPLTSSAGRLFDAVAALVGLPAVRRFEGEAAMGLEFALRGLEGDERYDFAVVPVPTAPGAANDQRAWVLDWRPALAGVKADVTAGTARGAIALRFHNTLAEMIVDIASRAGLPAVALTGGCFQNRYLTERAVRRLAEEGFRPYWHRRIPPGDGGLAVGQLVAAASHLRERS
jgi:hydrogenase maturation protein HypF